jgi:hypothetical protein
MDKPTIPAILFCLFAYAASGQTVSPQGTAATAWGAVPPDVFATSQLYHALFKQVVVFQQMASALQSKGKNSSGALHEIKRQAGLTDPEEATLTATATTCITAFEAGEKSANAIVTQFMSQNPKGTQMPAALKQQYQAQKGQDLQSILNSVQQLQTSFGHARFQNLDNYVRTTIAKGVNTTPPVLKYGTPSGLPPQTPAKQ